MRFSTSFVCASILCAIASAAPTSHSSAGLVARDCSSEVAAYNLARREKRDIAKRSFYQTIPNPVCLLAPDVPREDYVTTSSNLIRRDVTEGQVGLPFTLDIGVIDVTTCKPVTGAMVEIWSPNAKGEYGTTFLRGAQASGSNGIAEFQTIFPGFTSEGANHVSIAVHTGNSLSSPVTHSGQLFFTDPWTNIISMSADYQGNTHTRIMNANDPNFVAADSNGYSGIINILSIQDDWPAGIIGDITVGINPSKTVQ